MCKFSEYCLPHNGPLNHSKLKFLPVWATDLISHSVWATDLIVFGPLIWASTGKFLTTSRPIAHIYQSTSHLLKNIYSFSYIYACYKYA